MLNENDGVVRLFFFFLYRSDREGSFRWFVFPHRIDFRYLVVFSRRIRKNLDNADDVIWRYFSSFIYLFFFCLDGGVSPHLHTPVPRPRQTV
jgi:hypothetical protein